MAEAIRLVIWDLDETFWGGTLTEGGIAYNRANHDIVVELAKRGIVSSIVSKNDFVAVREILTASGLWDYFVFPSINWEAKGPRLKDIVQASQLRPATILFVDDNHLNRAEALHYVPDMCVESEAVIPTMLEDPMFLGKDDASLTRLRQYKLLEQKQVEMRDSVDNTEFLRSSEIVVRIDFDIESNIDRAIELINRTNQLNFTKKRLPDDIESARLALLSALRAPNVQAGLVQVRDKFGDYGFVGFYLQHVHTWQLEHYCFSCRTLGMAVESWLFDLLKRPRLSVVGPVVTDLFVSRDPIDWIRQQTDAVSVEAGPKTGRVLMRGACELQALSHYVAIDAVDIVGEYGLNHTTFNDAVLLGLTRDRLDAAQSIGYRPDCFASELISDPGSFDAIILSPWNDAHTAVYRHRVTGLVLPYQILGIDNGRDLTRLTENEIAQHLQDVNARETHAALCRDFECIGWTLQAQEGTDVSLFEAAAGRLFATIPAATPIFILLACDEIADQNGNTQIIHHLAALNKAIRAAASNWTNVLLIDIKDAFDRPEDIIDVMHFDRMVYYRVYKEISARWAGWRATQAVLPTVNPIGSR